MADNLTFSLVAPERELFAGEVTAVSVPGTEGQFEVLPNHAPMMSTLSPGILTIQDGKGAKSFFVRGGFADVGLTGMTVLAERAVPVDELKGDVLAAEKDLARREGERAGTPEDKLNAERAQAALTAY